MVAGVQLADEPRGRHRRRRGAAAGRVADERPADDLAVGAGELGPPLLFGLYAGVLSDRHDRRGIVLVANAVRALVLVALVVLMTTGAVTVVTALALPRCGPSRRCSPTTPRPR